MSLAAKTPFFRLASLIFLLNMSNFNFKTCLASPKNGIFSRSKLPIVPGLLIFLALGFYAPKGCHLSRPAVAPPNIVLIFTDDQGYQDVGCFGAQGFSTPNLDQMARDGIRLTNFYVAQPVCSASRAALLTGCYSSRVDMHHALMPRAKKGLNLRETTIAEMLKARGYATACFGKWHLGDNPEFMPLRQGFDEYFGIPYSNDMWPIHPNPGMRKEFPWLPLYEGEKTVDSLHDQTMLTTWVTEHAVSFIDRHRRQPFFLYVPHPMPHVPLFVSDKFRGKSAKGLYGDVIMEIDWSVGEILAALRRNGLEENTLVIFTSDNGPWLAYGNHAGSALPLREGKGTVWEGGVREPFIMQWKGHLPAGAVINEPLMTIDLLPTIASVTGAPCPICRSTDATPGPYLPCNRAQHRPTRPISFITKPMNSRPCAAAAGNSISPTPTGLSAKPPAAATASRAPTPASRSPNPNCTTWQPTSAKPAMWPPNIRMWCAGWRHSPKRRAPTWAMP